MNLNGRVFHWEKIPLMALVLRVVKHSLLEFHRQDFLHSVVTELSRVPVVLGVHARKDSMSSFRDVTWLFWNVSSPEIRDQSHARWNWLGKGSDVEVKYLKLDELRGNWNPNPQILGEVKKIIQKCKVPLRQAVEL